MWVEYIGIIASLFLLLSICFKTESIKGSIWMRVFNIVGSIIFATYGWLLPAYSTACLNSVLVVINIVRLIQLIKKSKIAES